jgi:hypothetical protein
VGRDAHEYCDRSATFHVPEFAPYSTYRPLRCVRRFSFRGLSRFGPRRVRQGVIPSTTPRSPWHPVKGFPCSLALDSATWGRWRLPCILSRLLRFPTRHGVTPGEPMTPRAAAYVLQDTGAVARLCCPDQARSLADQGGSARRTFPRRMKPASDGFTIPRLRQAQPLGYLLSPHCAFQGHAAHTGERPPVLSPNDVSAPWESREHYRLRSHSCIPTPSLHGALKSTQSFITLANCLILQQLHFSLNWRLLGKCEN